MSVRVSITCCLVAATAALVPDPARAAAFEDATAELLGETGEWSHKVELADLDGDGRVDIVIANGGDYNAAGVAAVSFAFMQNADGTFTDHGPEVFGAAGFSRAIKAGDVDGDDDLDLVVAGAWQTRSRLLINDGAGAFTNASDRLPEADVSAGDLELGDADGDGDLDVLVADMGDGDPFFQKGRPLLWINDGYGRFVDETDARFPTAKTGFSWDAEWADVDDDGDLDALVSCKVCTDAGLYFENQGDGTFLDRSGLLPGAGNNYEFEAMDMDGDGDLDLVTINDGRDLEERILRNELNEASGLFVDASGELWYGADNTNDDDNAAVLVDLDSDGDTDVLVGSLSGEDRLLENDGEGSLTLKGALTDGPFTPGTLGMALADLDGDRRLDLVMCQGEADVPEKIFRGVDVAEDTAAPVVSLPRVLANGDVLVRIHDGRVPVKAHDFTSITLSTDDGEVPLRWVGEMLWRGTPSANAQLAHACATDAAGNQACGQDLVLRLLPAEPKSCGAGAMPAVLGLFALLFVRSRTRSRR